MRRLLSFLDECASLELVLPVTPASYEWEHANRVETIHLDQTGGINLPGGRLMGSITLSDVLFPAKPYPFCNPGASTNPYLYLEQLERWSDAGSPVRFLVSGTPTNAQVLVESVRYGERDGTNDVYATLTLRQYRVPDTPVLDVSGGGVQASREERSGAARERAYTIQQGDTLWGIAQKYYGSGAAYKRLAQANQDIIQNPNLIYPGQTIVIPAKDGLPQAAADSRSVALADETKSAWDQRTGAWNLTLQ